MKGLNNNNKQRVYKAKNLLHRLYSKRTHARTHARMLARTHARTHARTQARTQAHTHTHTRRHAHTHTHTHTRTQEAAHTTYQLLFPSYLTRSIQNKKLKSLTCNKTCSAMEYCRKRQDRKRKKTRQKNKRGYRKGESDDSPDSRQGLDKHPWPPFDVVPS